MNQFRVIDLYSQADAVRAHVDGWAPEEVLTWLRQFGRVDLVGRWNSTGPALYVFQSPAGPAVGFAFRDADGSLWIVGKG
jgi:hypothetical protein